MCWATAVLVCGECARTLTHRQVYRVGIHTIIFIFHLEQKVKNDKQT